MSLDIRKVDYGSIRRKVHATTKAAALHPYVRLFVLLTTFVVLLAAVIIKDEQLPALSSPKGGPSGYRAWEDLQSITQHPHPWNSRRNDEVRAYVLKEMQRGNYPDEDPKEILRKVADEYDDVVVIDDQASMVLDDRKDLITRLAGSDNITVTYFEGLNILVRIPGTSKIREGAILLSSHIDSVSTAPGATVPPKLTRVDVRMMAWELHLQWNWSGILRNIAQREISLSISTMAKKTSSGELKCTPYFVSH